MADEEVVALVVDYGSGLRLLVLLVMHLALCSDVAGPFFLLLSSCTWKFVHYFYEPLYFQHFSQSKFCASRFFGALEHSQL